MAFERQADVVAGARRTAAVIDDAIRDWAWYRKRYDQLSTEVSFASGIFSTTQEITAPQLLGGFNSFGGLTDAASTHKAAWDAWIAALQMIRG